MDSICQECIRNCYPDNPREACFGDYKSLCARCWRYEEIDPGNFTPEPSKLVANMLGGVRSPLSERVRGLESGLQIMNRVLKERIEKGRKPVKKDYKGIELEHT